MPVLEQLDKSQHVIRLCEYALEIIQKASSDACAKGILDFGVNPRLASPVCGSAPISAMDGRSMFIQRLTALIRKIVVKIARSNRLTIFSLPQSSPIVFIVESKMI